MPPAQISHPSLPAIGALGRVVLDGAMESEIPGDVNAEADRRRRTAPWTRYRRLALRQ
jgi:hypothetical protein